MFLTMIFLKNKLLRKIRRETKFRIVRLLRDKKKIKNNLRVRIVKARK